MTAKFHVVNWTEFNRACNKALDIASAYVLQQALEFVPRSERQPPKDPSGPVTGNLGNSLTIAEATSLSDRKPMRLIGTNVHYGVYQEFGTRNIPPRPFLGPALELARRRYG
jgi:phage gpG-like protein